MYQVSKRDGTAATFEIGKISAAITKAFQALDKQFHPSVIDLLALRVTADFEPKVRDGRIAVEDIQDSVEAVLSEAGYADVAKAYGVDSICISSADEFKPALEKAIEANKAGKPFLVEAPMENIVVPTPGCWNINDIYSPNELVKEGKLVKKENGQYVAPSHSSPTTPDRDILFATCLQSSISAEGPLHLGAALRLRFAESLFSEKMFSESGGRVRGSGSPSRMEIPTPRLLRKGRRAERGEGFPPWRAEKNRDAG